MLRQSVGSQLGVSCFDVTKHKEFKNGLKTTTEKACQVRENKG